MTENEHFKTSLVFIRVLQMGHGRVSQRVKKKMKKENVEWSRRTNFLFLTRTKVRDKQLSALANDFCNCKYVVTAVILISKGQGIKYLTREGWNLKPEDNFLDRKNIFNF